jgi:hypothetical protein
LVPVPFLIPQATQVEWEEFESPDFGKNYRQAVERATIYCHIHECDDSFLGGVDYEIPPTSDESFHMEGVVYTREQVLAMMYEQRHRDVENRQVVSGQ